MSARLISVVVPAGNGAGVHPSMAIQHEAESRVHGTVRYSTTYTSGEAR